MLSDGEVPSISEIEPGLFIGDFESSKDIRLLMRHNISAIVSLGNRRAREWDRVGNRILVAEEDHLIVHCTDQPTEDILSKLLDICNFIDSRLNVKPDLQLILGSPPRRKMQDGLEDLDTSSYFAKHNVLVHCNLGISRSPTVVAAYLMRKRHQSRTEVLASILRRRKVHPIQNFLDQLEIWQEVNYNPWEDLGRKVPKEPYRRFLENMKEKTGQVVVGERNVPENGWSLASEAARNVATEGKAALASLVFFAPPA